MRSYLVGNINSSCATHPMSNTSGAASANTTDLTTTDSPRGYYRYCNCCTNPCVKLAILNTAFNHLEALLLCYYVPLLSFVRLNCNKVTQCHPIPYINDLHMAKFFNQLNDAHIAFIQQQKLFFTATAAQSGRINLSPKGMDTLRILNPNTVAYLDLTGSGNETAAHIAENGRITIMFCSFDEDPLILRLYGRGEVITPNNQQWHSHIKLFKPLPGTRQIIAQRIDSVQTSCGYAVPLYQYEGERDTLARWAEKKGEQGIRKYWEERNQSSIDGLPTHLLDKDS